MLCCYFHVVIHSIRFSVFASKSNDGTKRCCFFLLDLLVSKWQRLVFCCWWPHSWFNPIDNASMIRLRCFSIRYTDHSSACCRKEPEIIFEISKRTKTREPSNKRFDYLFAVEFAQRCGTSVENSLFLRECSYAFATLAMLNIRLNLIFKWFSTFGSMH